MTLWFRRGVRYTTVGVTTFLLDLALLFILIDALNFNVLVSTGFAFVGALTLNYIISRRFVFPHSDRSTVRGYMYFFIFALIGMLTTVLCMWFLVSFTPLHYIVSRIIIAFVVGVGNYYANLMLNFKVAGVEIHQK